MKKLDSVLLPKLGLSSDKIGTRNNEENGTMAVVYATASLKTCPDSIINDATVDAISDMLRGKDHL